MIGLVASRPLALDSGDSAGTDARRRDGEVDPVVLNSSSDGTISGLVSLKNAAPDTAFLVFLNQEGTCYKNPLGVLETNAQGNGVLRFSRDAVGSWAVVALQSESGVEQEFASGVFEH